MTKAFVFDIDGVLLKGSKVLPGAAKALNLLNKYRIPWIVLTNGGGTLEKDRVAELSRRIEVPIKVEQFLQSHTPYKQFTGNHRRILAIGGKQASVREVALSYGFKDVITTQQIVAANPVIQAFPNLTATMAGYNRMLDGRVDITKKFDGIFTFHDSYDFSTDAQVVVDLLVSKEGQLGTRRDIDNFDGNPSIPIYFSCADLQWAADYNLPRFGQGAFIETVRTLYKALTKHELKDTVIGKPTKFTYGYADKLLKAQARALGATVSGVWMVGDNQNSDIKGANDYGWNSILVRTGVYQSQDKLFTKPTSIENDVYAAVLKVLEDS